MFCCKHAKYVIRKFSKRADLYLQSNHILYHFSSIFLPLNDLFTLIKICSMSSPQDQVSNFIVNNDLKFTFKFRIKPQCYDKKISTISITPSL